MKKILLSLFCLVLALGIKAQGLEKVYVETYYVSDANDQANSITPLPAGSITYRFYLDMLPGYTFKLAYGASIQPLIISSPNSAIYNHESGLSLPTFTKTNVQKNTVMLDSWVTGGGTTNGYYAVPKEFDAAAGGALFVNSNIPKLLQNGVVATKNYNIPLTTQDGMWTAVVEPCKTIGIDTELGLLGTNDTDGDGTVDVQSSFIVNSEIGGGWGPLNGVMGVTPENMVLIAQITLLNNATNDPILNYDFNIQLSSPTGGKENYSTRPLPTDFSGPQYKLSGTLNASVVLPTASITSPAAGTTFTEPASVTINGNAVAGTNSIQKVEFLVDGVKVGEDLTAPYSLPWTSVAKAGNTNLTVRAVDSDGNAGAESAIVGINVNGNAAPVVTGLTATPSPAYIADAITLKATVTDDVAVAGVVFKVDGNVVPGTVVKTVNDYTIVYTVAGAKGNRSWSVEATDNGTPAKVTTVNNTFTVGNKIPTISVAPASFSIVAGNDTTFVASVGDLDGSVSKVDFTIDGVTTTDASAPFEFTYVAIGSGSKTLNAVATDDNNATASASVTFSVVPPSGKDYELGILSELCSTSDVFCMPIKAAKAVSNVTGYDITVIFDHLKVNPTGIVNVVEGSSAFVGDRDYTSYNVHLYPGTDSMKISLWLNTTAPAGTTFTGAVGNTLACVEFSRLSTFGSNGTTSFSTRVLQESSTTGYKLNGATPGSYSTHRETEFAGSLSFWSDNSPIAYTAGINLITNIFGDKNPSVKVQPDVNGNFVYNITNGTKITIDRDGDNTFDVQTTIGGLDAYYTAKVTVDDANFKPSVYQLISMDVNRDGRVTAGDITQIQQRTVLHIGEFTQVGNEHRDWLFVPSTTVLTDDHYRISPSFPYAGSYGYYKNAVPQVSVVKDLEALQLVEYTKLSGNDTCTSIKSENFKGILLGDVTGNYAALAPSTKFKSGSLDATKFMVELRMKADNEYEMIISSANSDVINGYDFSFDCSKFTALTSASDIAKMNLASNLVDNRILVSGYNLGSFKNGKLASISLKANDVVSLSDISVVTSSINESPVAFELSAKDVTGVEVVNGNEARVWPNPASDVLFVTVNEKATVTLLDVKGRVVVETIAYANENNEINVANLPAGVYLVKIVGKKVTETKIIVQK